METTETYIRISLLRANFQMLVAGVVHTHCPVVKTSSVSVTSPSVAQVVPAKLAQICARLYNGYL